MRDLTSLILLAVMLAGVTPAQERLAAGTEGPLAIEGCEFPGLLYVPTDYVPGRRMPLIFFLHGSGGKPTSWPWRSATKGEGYFICGLPYGVQDDGGAGGIHSDPKTREAMVEFIDRVRAQLDETYGIAQEHVILTGLSMGGWGVNFYGFIESARDRYCAYAILAAGPRKEVALEVAAGKRVLLLNGANDQNLAVANSGKPALEAAGAIVEQVVLEGEGHVPSLPSMSPPLATWLGRVRADIESSRPASAVEWIHLRLDDRGPADRGPEALARYLASQTTVSEGRKGRPALLFGVSTAVDGKGRPTRGATKSTDAEEDLFCYPSSCEIALAARAFACFRFEVTDRAKKEHPHLNRDTAPLVVLLDGDGGLVTVLGGNKLRSASLAAALRDRLDETARAELDERAAAMRPLLGELEKVVKKRKKAEKKLAKLRRSKRPSPKKIGKLEDELATLGARRDQLLARL